MNSIRLYDGDAPGSEGVPDDERSYHSDDQLGLADDSVSLYTQWRATGVPVEMHLYAAGGRGFGLRTQQLPSDTRIDRSGDWLAAMGLG